MSTQGTSFQTSALSAPATAAAASVESKATSATTNAAHMLVLRRLLITTYPALLAGANNGSAAGAATLAARQYIIPHFRFTEHSCAPIAHLYGNLLNSIATRAAIPATAAAVASPSSTSRGQTHAASVSHPREAGRRCPPTWVTADKTADRPGRMLVHNPQCGCRYSEAELDNMQAEEDLDDLMSRKG